MAQLSERKLALDILLKVKTENEAVGLSLNRSFGARKSLEKRSRAFITHLVYGTLENLIQLDYIIEKFSKIPVKKMRPQVATILEMSVYQLMFLDNVPASAVCNEAVKIASKLRLDSLKAFINGVLRNIVRNIEYIEFPDIDREPVKGISIRYSIPEWVIHLWLKEMSIEKIEKMLIVLRRPHGIYIRCNTNLLSPAALRVRLKQEGVKVETNEVWPDYTLRISGMDSIESLEAFQKGWFYVQDLSCMLSGEMYGLKGGEKVLDMCAAPGGKSINAALILSGLGGGRVDSQDLTDSKTKLIKENVDRLKIENINVRTFDSSREDKSHEEEYDLVIADLPCSGLGIIGRKPDILLNRKPEDIDELVKIQKQILVNAKKYVKKGGKLVYSTCTISKAENEDIAMWIESYLGMKREALKLQLPGIDGECDGFFTAVFRK